MMTSSTFQKRSQTAVWTIAMVLFFTLGCLSLTQCQAQSPEVKKQSMIKITSPAFHQEEMIPPQYTCVGKDINPPLHIEDVPASAKSLALIVDDPDAPMGIWYHWLVWNIDPKTKEIPENSVPPHGVQGKNDFGKTKYGGPCPPFGTHRYYYRVFALDTQLHLPPGADKEAVKRALAGHVIDEGELMGKFSKK